MLKSSSFHNAKTEYVPAVRDPRNPATEQSLKILKPGEAVHELFMAVSAFYANHRLVEMTPEVRRILRAIVTRQKENTDQILDEAITVLEESAAARDTHVREALAMAQLSLLAHTLR